MPITLHRYAPALAILVGMCVTKGVFADGPAADGQIILQQTFVGPMPSDTRRWAVSPDASRVALVADSGSRQQVFIDGVPGPVFGSILQLSGTGQGDAGPRLLTISPDNKVVAYCASKSPTEVVMVVNHKEGPAFDQILQAKFDPVGHHLTYTAQRGGQNFVVLDDNVGVGNKYVLANEIVFSADGQHHGFVAQTNDTPAMWRAIIDGKEGSRYVMVSRLTMGKTGRYAYVGCTSNDVTDLHMVVDDRQGPQFGQIYPAIFSSDGNHVGYIATKRDRAPGKMSPASVAVIDGQIGPEFEQVDQLKFSPDGKHYAYSGTESARQVNQYAIVDGKRSMDYVFAGGFVFSDDGQHLAYKATSSTATGTKSLVVLDGKEQQPFEQIDQQTIRFSPDGKHLGYAARDGSNAFAVVDGVKSPAYSAIDPRSFEWSTALGDFRYKIRGYNDDWKVAVGTAPAGPRGAPIEWVTTPDGQRAATAVVADLNSPQEGVQVLMNGKPVGGIYGRVDQLQISADGEHVAFIASAMPNSGKKGAFVVHDGHESAGYTRIDKLALSPDGKHVAYNVTADGPKYYVIVDSIQGPAYEQVPLGLTPALEALQFRPDGSLVFLAVTDGKLCRMVYPATSLAAIPGTSGGAAGNGNMSAAAAAPPTGYAEVYTFGSVPKDGYKPNMIAVGADGSIFGATSAGGKYQKGVLFRVKPDGTDYAIIHNFAGGQTDGYLCTGMAIASDGAVYGSLMGEGPRGQGAIFRCTPDGSDYKIVQAFDGSDSQGSSPTLEAIDPDGTMYGLAKGRPDGIFRVKADGSEMKLVYHPAPATRGFDTTGVGEFSDGGDGYLYGVNRDSIFKIKKDGTGYAIARKFQGEPVDVGSTNRPPIVGSDGVLYGIAPSGGSGMGGVIFRLKRDGSDYAIIVNPDGEALEPRALAEGADGKMYLLAHKGLCRMNKDGTGMEVLQEMSGGMFPWCAVSHAGTIYSCSAEGAKGGIVFRYGTGSGGGAAAVAPTKGAPSLVIQNVPPTPLQ